MTWTPPNLAQWETADFVVEDMLQDQVLNNLTYLLNAVNASCPIGAIIPMGRGTAPPNFLACDGALVSRSTYAALFGVIGTAFGVGDGSSTFGVPDFRGRFPLGKAVSGTGSVLGETGGSLGHTHTNPDTDSGGSHAHSQGNTGAGGDHAHSQGATGSGGSHNHTFSGTTGATDLVSNAGGSHSHTVSDTTGGPSSGNYFGVGSTEFGPSASHTHSFSGSTSSAGSHSHTFDTHAHSMSDTVTTATGHTHTNPNTSTAADHAHTNPNVSSAGSHVHNITATGGANPPFQVVAYYIKALNF